MTKKYGIAIITVALAIGLLGGYYMSQREVPLPDLPEGPYQPRVMNMQVSPDAPSSSPMESGQAVHAGSLDVAAERLAARLAKNPEDVDSWLLLAHTYDYLKRPEQARQAMDKAREHGYTEPTQAQAGAAAASSVQGQVQLAAELAGKVQATDTLFVYAKAVEGPGMPLAIKRYQAGELPLQFSLDDSMAMSPGTKLSGFQRVRIYARISRSGQAMPSAGDLVGQSDELNPAGGQSVAITIDHVL